MAQRLLGGAEGASPLGDDAPSGSTPLFTWVSRSAHDRVEDVVERHDGEDDGGESGWLNIATGKPAYDSAADEWFAEGEA